MFSYIYLDLGFDLESLVEASSLQDADKNDGSFVNLSQLMDGFPDFILSNVYLNVEFINFT